MLGDWAASVKDLGTASSIDFDDEAAEWLAIVKPNAKKITEHQNK